MIKMMVCLRAVPAVAVPVSVYKVLAIASPKATGVSGA